MKETLFRGKREDNKEWVEGFYCKRKTGHYTGMRFAEKYKECIIKEFSDGGIYFAEVDPETACQYTGLTDKNIKKIFEEDIVKKDSDIGVVKFGKYGNGFHYGFYVQWVTCLNLRPELAFWNSRVECVGNIFDNPELLNKGDESE